MPASVTADSGAPSGPENRTATRLDTERVGRTLAEVTSLLARRERMFLEHGIDSMATLRRRRAAGEFPEEAYGDVFLIVDGWSTVRQDFQDDIPALSQIAARGLNYGIHLVITAARWVELVAAIRDQAGTKLELRMGDAMDSVVDIRKAGSVPRSPGRGLTVEGKLHYLAALPRIDGAERADDLADGVSDLVAAVTESWPGPGAPAVRMLPTRLDAHELPPVAPERRFRFPLGLEETELGTAWHDFAETPHLVLFGDSETGKTNLLRLMAQHIVRTFTPAEARILVVDYRRQLVEAVPEEYRLGHAVSVDQLRKQVTGVGRALAERTPGQDISPARMRLADWWDGAPAVRPGGRLRPGRPTHADSARTASGAPAAGLRGRRARDRRPGHRGRHSRRQRPAGAARPGGQRPGLLLSCPPSEGHVFGVKPRVLPPGRGLYVTRRRTVQIQTAVAAPEAAPGPEAG